MKKTAMTYDQVATFYQKKTGRTARTTAIETILEWLGRQPEVEYNEDKDEFYMRCAA